jgi:hypothetical protein
MLSTFAYEAAGASDARLSLRPLFSEGQAHASLGRSRRGIEYACMIGCLTIEKGPLASMTMQARNVSKSGLSRNKTCLVPLI